MIRLIILLGCIFIFGCPDFKQVRTKNKVWWNAVHKLCKQTCPSTTFRYRAEQIAGIHAHFYKCYCYPQFGAPKITHIDHRKVREEIKRQGALPFKNRRK